MSKKLSEHEYIFFKCNDCDERVKVAKNRGSGAFWMFDNFTTWLNDFTLKHSECNATDIIIEIE